MPSFRQNQSCHTVLPRACRIALLTLSLWQFAWPALAIEPAKDSRPAEYFILRFPGRGKIGEVGEISNSEKYDGKHTPLKSSKEALGTLPFAKGSKLHFRSRDFMGLEKPLDIIQTFPVEALYSLELSNNILDEKDLGKVLKFQNLRRLEVGGTDFSDNGLRVLAKLPNLEAIAVDHTRTNGSFLVDFASSKKLKLLVLNHNDIDRKYLKELPNFPHLHWLDIGNCHIKDEDTANLTKCTELVALKLDENNDITDKSLPNLKQLKNLERLWIESTKITNKGLLTLKGLPLKYIRISRRKDDAKDIEAIKKTFPKIEVVYATLMEKSYKIYKDAFE